MKIVRRNYFVLLLLALLFITPGLAAYLFYKNPQWLGAATTNKGELLTPPVQLKMKGDGDGQVKWRFVLWNPGDCGMECLNQLNKLARIRLALGRRLYEVEQVLILENDTELPPSLINVLKEQDIRVQRISKSERDHSSILKNKARVFIATADDYLILVYSLNAAPGDLFHDIKQLLSTTEQKSG